MISTGKHSRNSFGRLCTLSSFSSSSSVYTDSYYVRCGLNRYRSNHQKQQRLRRVKHDISYSITRHFSSTSPSPSTEKLSFNNDEPTTDTSSVLSIEWNDKEYLQKQYNQKVRNCEIENDEYQIMALKELDRLRNDIFSEAYNHTYQKKIEETAPTEIEGTNLMESFFGKKHNNSDENNIFSSFLQSSNNNALNTAITNTISPSTGNSPQGVYLHGGVGCGKTFCMNLFYDSLNPQKISKQKVHFHKFMLSSVHQKIHEAKQTHGSKTNVMNIVVDQIANDGKVICFDEFQVTDVADAVLLRELFTSLIREKNCVVLTTSNRPPHDLYLNGISRKELFVPFLDMFCEHVKVINMDRQEEESAVDYRALKELRQKEKIAKLKESTSIKTASISTSSRLSKVHFIEDDSKNDGNSIAMNEFEELFHEVTYGDTKETLTTETTNSNNNIGDTFSITTLSGRKVQLQKDTCHISFKYKTILLDFDDICRSSQRQSPLGASDYLAIGEQFHTIFIRNIPGEFNIVSGGELNVLRRFILFVDSMYECHCKLVLHLKGGCEPKDIKVVDGSSSSFSPNSKITSKKKSKRDSVFDEVFAFDRTLSRLKEMSTDEYLEQPWIHDDNE